MTEARLTYKMTRKLATLERRAAYLEKVVSNSQGSTGSLDRDAGELSALKWAIETICAHYQLEEEDQ